MQANSVAAPPREVGVEERFEIFSPIDGKQLRMASVTPLAEVRRGIEACRTAQRAWARQSVSSRLDVLQRVRLAFHAHVTELVDAVYRETGKPKPEIYGGEIIANLELFDFYLKHAERLLAPEKVALNKLNYPGKSGHVFLRPLGLVGVVSSWNYPVALPMRAIVPALVAGNGVVFKPSVQATLVGEVLAKIFTSALPDNLLITAYGGRHVANAVVDGVDKVNFIGSVDVGRKIAQRCAERFVPCSTELSGKDAAIVLEDCDLSRTVNGIIWGAFTNAGQNCASVERAYVHEGIYDAFMKLLLERVQTLRLGQDVGPLRSERQVQLVESHLQSVKNGGGRILCGGERRAGTLFITPTVIEVLDHDAEFMREETFGPTLPVQRIKSLEEGLRLANSSKFGLTGSIWTRNISVAQAKAAEMDTGVVTINNCVFTGAVTAAPWGGVKNTGHGVTNSKYGLLEMTRPQFVLVDGSKADKETWWYPYSEHLEQLMQTVIRTLGPGSKLGAYLKLPKLLRQVGQTRLGSS